MPPAIELFHVAKSYPLYRSLSAGFKHFLLHLPRSLQDLRAPRHLALRDITLSIAPGEAVGFIGGNGAGKSTLLGLMAGVLSPTTGRITVRGRVCPLLELGAGFHFELTGRDNILLNGVLLGLTRTEIQARLEAIVAYAELEAFIDQPIRTYSSGMLARLGFAVAAHLDPEILLVDETLAVGDARFQKKCQATMAAFRQAGVTLVLVSHNMDDVRAVCSRAIWLDRGQVRLDGDPTTVIDAYLQETSHAPAGP